MEPIVKVKNLTKIYNHHTSREFEALHAIDFEVYKGEFICIMGPSGSGKSTFINNISTIDLPTSGLVYINGIEIRTMSSNEIGKFRYQHLGFIFQDFHLLDTHTNYENIAMPLMLAKVKKTIIKEKVLNISKELEIDHLLDKYPNECSGGQQQRICIARALINNPELIVADEPTGNLDSKHSQELLDYLKQRNNEGTTIIMVTHDPFVASFSSRLVMITDGIISNTLHRENKSQNAYFEEIVALNSKQTQELLK